MRSEKKCTLVLLGKNWLCEFSYKLEGGIIYLAFIDEDVNLNIYFLKKGNVINTLKDCVKMIVRQGKMVWLC